MADLFAYIAGAALVAWGSSHLAPTASVADSFGPISEDSRRILVMEWVAEGITHMSEDAGRLVQDLPLRADGLRRAALSRIRRGARGVYGSRNEGG